MRRDVRDLLRVEVARSRFAPAGTGLRDPRVHGVSRLDAAGDR